MKSFGVTERSGPSSLFVNGKCLLPESGANRELPFGRCGPLKSFNELYDGFPDLDE